MANFLPFLTSQFLMDEASGQLIDVIGGFDTDIVSGTPVFDQPGITYDGVSAGHNWGTADDFIEGNLDYTLYLKLKITNIMAASNEFFFSTDDRDGTRQGPYLQWLGSAQTFRVTNHLGSGSAIVPFDIGRNLTVGETWVLVIAHQATAMTTEGAFHSDTDENSSGTTVGTNPAGWGATDNYILAIDGASGNAAPLQALELGSIAGIARPKQDLIDTAAILINGLPPDIPIGAQGKTSFRVDPINQLRWNKGIQRFVRS